MPFLKGASACQWTTAIKSRSETVPAPGQQLLSGYVVVNEEGVQALLSSYDWNDTDAQISIALPQGHSIPAGKMLESKELTKRLPTLSTYHQGSLFLSPGSGTLYFELTKN